MKHICMDLQEKNKYINKNELICVYIPNFFLHFHYLNLSSTNMDFLLVSSY